VGVVHTRETVLAAFELREAGRNLAWGSHTDNAADRIANGNQHRPAGMKHHRATLTDEIVRLIRARREAGASLLEIQGEFDVDYRRVSAICLRKSWAHVA
jgi:hypothetical protein